MRSLYNRIAGQNLERLAALSDGLFAVAMTLLVLDLRAPSAEAIHSEHDLLARIGSVLAPRLLTYLMSFLTLGIFWLGQQAQLDRLERSDRDLAWMHVAFLCVVSLVPFSTALLAEFITYRVALVVYWGNILLLGSGTSRDMAPCNASGTHQGRYVAGSRGRDMPPDHHRANVVRVGRGTLHFQHLLEHRLHCAASAQLRHRTVLAVHTG